MNNKRTGETKAKQMGECSEQNCFEVGVAILWCSVVSFYRFLTRKEFLNVNSELICEND